MIGYLLQGTLMVLPALLLIAALAVGVHPGERAITRLAERCAPRRRRRATAAPASPVIRAVVRVCRGGLLVACSAARRGPPRSAPHLAIAR